MKNQASSLTHRAIQFLVALGQHESEKGRDLTPTYSEVSELTNLTVRACECIGSKLRTANIITVAQDGIGGCQYTDDFAYEQWEQLSIATITTAVTNPDTTHEAASNAADGVYPGLTDLLEKCSPAVTLGEIPYLLGIKTELMNDPVQTTSPDLSQEAAAY